MYEHYGIYSSCRDAAWRFLLDFNVRSLPVKLKSATRLSGIRIIQNCEVNELRKGEVGASIYLPNKTWRIVYDETLPMDEARLVIAHELGHILLGHEYKYSEHRFNTFDGHKLKSEREADMFAVRILAPACILHELSATTPNEIAALCNIPLKTAKARAKRMVVLEDRGAFYKSPLEGVLRERFDEYIRTTLEKRA